MPETTTDHTAGAPAGEGQRTVMETQRAVWRFCAMRALVSIGCLDQLRDGPLTVDELADRCGANAPMLGRTLRTVASTGLLRTVSTGRYELTEAGRSMMGGVGLMALKYIADPEIWGAFGELPETIRTGQPPFVLRNGSFYDYLTAHPSTEAAFDQMMAGHHAPVAARLAQAVDFSGMRTIVDVGGGNGACIAAILRAYPGLRGILLELKRTVPAAREYLADNGVGDRCDVVAGDYFAAVPARGDAYLLSHVIHNWDDEKAAELLRTIRAAMPDHGRVLIVEAVLPDDDRPHWGKDLDMRLLSVLGGAERTEAEYSALLGEAGFRLDTVTELHREVHVVTASPIAGRKS